MHDVYETSFISFALVIIFIIKLFSNFICRLPCNIIFNYIFSSLSLSSGTQAIRQTTG